MVLRMPVLLALFPHEREKAPETVVNEALAPGADQGLQLLDVEVESRDLQVLSTLTDTCLVLVVEAPVAIVR